MPQVDKEILLHKALDHFLRLWHASKDAIPFGEFFREVVLKDLLRTRQISLWIDNIEGRLGVESDGTGLLQTLMTHKQTEGEVSTHRGDTTL